MAEEKQFEPTQSRVDRARREGDLARSPEVANVAAFAAALLTLTFVVTPLGAAVRVVLTSAANGTTNVRALSAAILFMLAPIGAAGAGAIVANVLQSGGLRFVAVTFKPQRLSPAANFKRMFSREAMVTAARASVAFISATVAIVPAFFSIFAAALYAGGVKSLAMSAWNGALHTAGVACAIGGIFASADYGLQFARWRKRLRMSLDELKRDQKEHDGDPLARSRRRSLHRQIARGSLQKVKDAAFVVTNPTHIAIALEYRPPQVPVPRVVVRAADEAAARVRELAMTYRVPLVENVALARKLYASAQPGEFIPQETYIAVAEVVAALRA